MSTDGKSLEEMVRDIHEVIFGNGDPRKGLILKVDRIEQGYGMVKWLAGVVIVALVGLFIGQIQITRFDNQARTETHDGR